MYQIVMPHENKDIKKINISQAAQSFSIFQTLLRWPFTTELICLTYQFVEYSINISIIFMHFAQRKSICFAHKRVFCLHSFLFKEKFLLLYYGLLWANVVIPITLCRVYHHDTPYFSAILEQKH